MCAVYMSARVCINACVCMRTRVQACMHIYAYLHTVRPSLGETACVRTCMYVHVHTRCKHGAFVLVPWATLAEKRQVHQHKWQAMKHKKRSYTGACKMMSKTSNICYELYTHPHVCYLRRKNASLFSRKVLFLSTLAAQGSPFLSASHFVHPHGMRCFKSKQI